MAVTPRLQYRWFIKHPLCDEACDFDDGGGCIGDDYAAPGRRFAASDCIAARTCLDRRGGKLPNLDDKMWTPARISKTVDRSPKNLGVESLDVMLLHSCDLKTLKDGGLIEPLVKARDAGKIKFVGYSGDNDAAA